MVSSNIDALGIIFPNSYDNMISELTASRLMAAVPFGGRYRMIDFILSSMVNVGIENVSIIVRANYHSLMHHLGSGSEWDLSRNSGGLNIVPPYSDKNVKVYNGRVEALASILGYLQEQKEKYVVMSDTNIAVNFDFKDMINQHIESGADITVAYMDAPIPAESHSTDYGKDLYYTLRTDDDGRVNEIKINSKKPGLLKYSMNIYVANREWLIQRVNSAYVRGYSYFERDVLAPHLDEIDLRVYHNKRYAARICDMGSYFHENMKLLDDENLDALFSPSQIYTKVRDDPPTVYINGAQPKNCLVSDGCLIEGDIENCILGRGVKVGKGAKVKNSIIMTDTTIEDGAELDYVILDKRSKITPGKKVQGTDSFQVYIAKDKTI